jgi:hypothetical protein
MDYIQRQIEIRKEKTEKDAGEKELEELYEQKEQLSEKRAQALDKLDIETGKKLEAQLIEISEKIEKQNRAKEDSLESLMKRKAELNQKLENNPVIECNKVRNSIERSPCAGALQGEGRAKSIMDTKNSLITALEKGEVSDSAIASMEKDVEALGAMLDFGSSLAMSSMKEVYIKMSGDACIHNTKAYDGLLAKMEQAIEESDVRTLEQKGGLTREMAEEVLREFDTTSKTAHVLGLGEYVRETGNGEIADLAEEKARLLSREKEFVFETNQILGENYIPIDILGDFAGYRYVWKDTGKIGILSRGREFYSFSVFSRKVEKNGTGDLMGAAADLKGTVCIPASYAEVTFGCQIREIFGTGYSVLAGDETIEKSKEVLSLLRQKGGVEWE